MAVKYTTNLNLPMATGGTQTWATYYEQVPQAVDHLLAGALSVTQVSGTKTLATGTTPTAEHKAFQLNVPGMLTSGLTIVVPKRNKFYLLTLANMNSKSVTVKTATATGWSFTATGSTAHSFGLSVAGTPAVNRRFQAPPFGAAEIRDGAITAAKVALGAISATGKVAAGVISRGHWTGATGYGVLNYSATAAGYGWTALPRGSAGQVLTMSTDAAPKPSWKTPSSGAISIFTATDRTWSSNSSFSLNHGLGGVPQLVYLDLVCISNFGGYVVGDVVSVYPDAGQPTGNYGFAIAKTATGLTVHIGLGFSFIRPSDYKAGAPSSTYFNVRTKAVRFA